MYTDIKTVSDAYQVTGRTAPVITGENAALLENINDLIVVSEAIREGWRPDYNDYNPKWLPWFDLEVAPHHCY